MHECTAPSSGYIRIHRIGDWTVVSFHGEIDIAAALAIGPVLDAVTALPRRRLVLDLNTVEFFDGSGLELLRRARRRSLARAGRLLLVCHRPLVLRLLRLARLEDAFTVLPSLTDALPDTAPGAERPPPSSPPPLPS